MNSSVKQLEPENRKFATLQPGGRGAAETEAKKGRWGWRESSKGLHKGRVLCKIIEYLSVHQDHPEKCILISDTEIRFQYLNNAPKREQRGNVLKCHSFFNEN